jgi:uncharacterized membrane protein YgcG
MYKIMNRLIFTAIIFLSSCTSFTKVESTSEKNIKPNEYTYSALEGKIHYNVTNDDKYVHIRLNTADYATINKILRSGLKFCFDVTGKMSQKVFFEYPLSIDKQASQRDRTRPAPGDISRFDLNNRIAQISNEGEFNQNGAKERILLASANTDVKASIQAVTNNEITCDLIFPISRISKEGFPSLLNLSVGIVSAQAETPMGGAGRSGGGRSGGGRSGGGRSISTGGAVSPASQDQIDFWFKLNLLKTN